MSVDDLPDLRHPLADQVDGIIDESTTAAELCEKLDFKLYEEDDRLRNSTQAASFEPMISALFLQTLEDYSDPERYDKLQGSEVASALEFDPDDLPSRSTFTQAWNDRFADSRKSI